MKNHYGVSVDSEVAVTGVFQTNNLEFIWDDANEGIDISVEEHNEECKDFLENEHCDCTFDSTDQLIGFSKEMGKYEEDEKAEYSAIVRGDSGVVQVVKSIWGIRCALCSPCYPGQGDGDTPGFYLAYSVPPDVVGDYGDQELKKRIFLIEEWRKKK